MRLARLALPELGQPAALIGLAVTAICLIDRCLWLICFTFVIFVRCDRNFIWIAVTSNHPV